MASFFFVFLPIAFHSILLIYISFLCFGVITTSRYGAGSQNRKQKLGSSDVYITIAPVLADVSFCICEDLFRSITLYRHRTKNSSIFAFFPQVWSYYDIFVVVVWKLRFNNNSQAQFELD